MEMPAKILDSIESFFGQYPERQLKKGHILIFPDESPEYITYIKAGQVRQYDIAENGDEIVVNVFKPPSFFPISWAVGRVPNRYFFATHSAATIHQAPADKTLEFLRANPEVTLDLLGRLYRGVDGMQRRMAHLMGGTARSRLLFELINEAKRFGGRDKTGSYVLKMSESELGARSGLTRETVSREIGELKKLNLIKMTPKAIVVRDIAELEKKLGNNL